MTSTKDAERLISASILRLRMDAPFFATLAMFAQFVPTTTMTSTAATDGKKIYYNPDYIGSLTPRQVDGTVLHEVLHAALLHPVRCGTRHEFRWNLAADVVVNGIVVQQPYAEVKKGSIQMREHAHRTAEEVYEIIEQAGAQLPDMAGDGVQQSEGCSACFVKPEGSDGKPMGGSMTSLDLAKMVAYWDQAMKQAEIIVRMGGGKIPLGMERALAQAGAPQIDWRAALWRFLVRTPSDFQGFDRRFFGRGLYLEALEGESIRAHVCIDTSGSIGPDMLGIFFAELQGILGAYPHIKADVYYADHDLYGPFDIEEQVKKPKPIGGGGTSFVPFFDKISEQTGIEEELCLYLTDGEGMFPEKIPPMPVLWVVTPGGIPDHAFPFGQSVRLLPNS